MVKGWIVSGTTGYSLFKTKKSAFKFKKNLKAKFPKRKLTLGKFLS